MLPGRRLHCKRCRCPSGPITRPATCDRIVNEHVIRLCSRVNRDCQQISVVVKRGARVGDVRQVNPVYDVLDREAQWFANFLLGFTRQRPPETADTEIAQEKYDATGQRRTAANLHRCPLRHTADMFVYQLNRETSY